MNAEMPHVSAPSALSLPSPSIDFATSLVHRSLSETAFANSATKSTLTLFTAVLSNFNRIFKIVFS